MNSDYKIEREKNNKVIVEDWKNFIDWAEEAGYDESYFNLYDSKCMALQEQYNDEINGK